MTASGALQTPSRAPGFVYQADVSRVATQFTSGAISTATGTYRWYNDTDRPLTIAAVRASAGTAPTGSSLIVDVNIDGTTAYTTQANRPAIAVSTNTIAATLPDVTSVAAGSYLSFDVDQVGSSVAGSNLTVQVTLYAA